jgi:hypothetical protein
MRTLKRLIVAFAAVLLVGFGAVAAYAWRASTINHLKDEKRQLQSQNESLKTALQNEQYKVAEEGYHSYLSDKGVKIWIYAPAKNALVTSPVGVIGRVPGSWSFEAQFPVMLKNKDGAVIAQGTAHLLGPWTTGELVPFSAELTYTKSVAGTGTLVLEKDNPSGLATNEDSVSIPVLFSQ